MNVDVPLMLITGGCLVAIPVLLLQARRRERAEADRRRMIRAAQRTSS